MITAAQMRAARALLQIDQRQLAELCGLSLPTIQRMEASDGVVRGNVDSLMKLVEALQRRRHRTDQRQRLQPNRRPRRAPHRSDPASRNRHPPPGAGMIALILACIAAFLALAVIGGVTARMPIGGPLVYSGCLVLSLTTMLAGLTSIAAPPIGDDAAALAWPSPAATSGWTRCRRSSCWWSGWAAPPPACSRSATGATKSSRSACCRSMPAFLAGHAHGGAGRRRLHCSCSRGS